MENPINNEIARMFGGEDPAVIEAGRKEYEKLSPKEKLDIWRREISSLTKTEFSNWSEEDKKNLIEEYNQLVRECVQAGGESESELSNEEELMAMLSNRAKLNVKDVREALLKKPESN